MLLMANEMRDRLVELIYEAIKEWDFYFNDCLLNGKPRSKTLNEFIADHLIENGVVVPPCKVGETLYLVQIDYEGDYFMTTISDVSKITMLSILRAYEEKTVVYMSTDKEQAEQKLMEVRGV